MLVLFVHGISFGEFDVLLHHIVFVDDFIFPGGGDGVGSKGIVFGCLGHVDVEFISDSFLCLDELLSILL